MPSIYLSPSLQPYNLYVVGDTNEQTVMNQIADAMVPYLRTNGITYQRNEIGGSLGQAIAASNAGDFDLHLALHSNASPESMPGALRGADFYYYTNSMQGRRAAEVLAENYKNIYPDPAEVSIRPTSTLVEVVKTNAPAVLAELAYHDNVEDAQWLLANAAQIAQNLVQGLTLYFDIPFIAPPQPPQSGTVATQTTPLRLRAKPNTQAAVIASMPKGAPITVLGEWQGWYVVEYNGLVGYAAAQYITIP